MDFYAAKKRTLPRFIYRNLAEQLAAAGAGRRQVLDQVIDDIRELQAKGDWLKLKWCLPPRLQGILDNDELQRLENALLARRNRRNERLIEVFPHCSDEFSLDTAFLDAAFGSARTPLVSPDTEAFTMGSCFAVNIANHLRAKGFNVTPFAQAEDLNSPFSNAKMLAVCAARPTFQRAYVTHWVEFLYPEEYRPRFGEFVESELARLETLAHHVTGSEVIIVTCGNIVDYFLAAPGFAEEPGPGVAPKFFSISASEDIELRQYLTGRMKATGAEFRLGSYAETLAALASQYETLRRLNPDATLIYTLSPVPIDSAIGIKGGQRKGAVELDCTSKSTLRAALAEMLDQKRTDDRLHYFPSFEIVRWIAPSMEGPVFGNEDAASRHVSQRVLEGVYGYFQHKFCRD